MSIIGDTEFSEGSRLDKPMRRDGSTSQLAAVRPRAKCPPDVLRKSADIGAATHVGTYP